MAEELPYTLLNGEEMNKTYPKTFQIPERKLRENLRADDIVKLGFLRRVSLEGEPDGERMWVMVERVEHEEPGVKYVGRLDNEPFVFAGEMRYGQRIVFRPEHVIAWSGPSPSHRPFSRSQSKQSGVARKD